MIKLKIYAFLIYTRLAFYSVKIMDECVAFAAAHTDCMKLRRSNCATPVVYSARGFSKKTGASPDITDLVSWVIDNSWDVTACGNTGGIQLNRLKHFTKYCQADFIWIGYEMGGAEDTTNTSEVDRHYVLIDFSSPVQIFRYTRAKEFDPANIKKITDPMFGELSFDPQSTWE